MNFAEATDIMFNSDKEKKAEMTKKLETETIPYALTKLEEAVQKNGGYLVLKKVKFEHFFCTSHRK